MVNAQCASASRANLIRHRLKAAANQQKCRHNLLVIAVTVHERSIASVVVVVLLTPCVDVVLAHVVIATTSVHLQ